MKKCPACAEYVQGKALVCRFCGRKFGGVGADAEPWITTSDIEKIQRRLQVAKASSYSRPSVLDEGVVAKHRLGTYSARPASWFKILTGDYTQKRGRRELFESFRDRIELFRSASPKRT